MITGIHCPGSLLAIDIVDVAGAFVQKVRIRSSEREPVRRLPAPDDTRAPLIRVVVPLAAGNIGVAPLSDVRNSIQGNSVGRRGNICSVLELRESAVVLLDHKSSA